MDVVNADFSDDTVVDRILDAWEEHKPDGKHSKHGIKGFLGDPTDQTGVSGGLRKDVLGEIKIMFFRCWLLIIRDPILYLGRMAAFLFGNIFFGFVYWNARPFVQERALDKMWINVWYCAVSTNSKCLSMSVYLYLLPFCDGLR